ncbi:MAG: FGGY family carbohydrate kinase [Actinomycetia bacterium]|nr:FGGY family carbohydrate kinase [Actinomycetes bacterium]
MLALGIDVGTTSTKVVVAAANGPLLVRSRPTPRDAGRLVADVLALVSEAVAASPTPPQAVGIASMAESGWLLDRSGEALGPMVSWTESRSGQEVQALVERVGWDALFEATGVRPGPKPPLAYWLELRREQPDLVRRVRWAGAADLVHLALTGQLVSDHTLAGRSLAYRLPPAGQPCAPVFDPELLAEAGMAPDQLPRVYRPGDPLARVLPGRSLAGCPVLVAGHDHQVAAWAAGVRQRSQVADSVGTAEAVLSLTEPVADRARLGRDGMSVTRAVDGVTEAVVAGSPSAGAFVQQMAEVYANGDVDQLLAGLPESGLASGSGLLPYPRGRQAPDPDPQARVRSWGPGPLPAPGTRALEAVCCQAQWLVQRQAEQVSTCDDLVVIGEAVRRSPVWQRVKASLADRPARLVTAPEPVACGAALLALVRAGLADPDSTTLPTVGLEPYPGLSQPYRHHLRSFIAAARQRV